MGRGIPLVRRTGHAPLRKVHLTVSVTESRSMSIPSPPNQQVFYEQVWSLVRQVARGKVVTYGQIAQMLPPPAEMDLETYNAFSPRWVGSAMAACPSDVP
jgi:O6-methylguanine-DNA--protein-cysteine methyltransferase